MPALFLYLFFTFIASLTLTFFIRKYAISREIMDIPNSRSSHTVPIPRGGGLAIVMVFLCSVLFMGMTSAIGKDLMTALMGGFLIALVGWADDHKCLPVLPRISAHFAAALWSVYWLGGFPSINLGFTTLHLGLMGYPLAVLGTVWMTNLYNFMDGIDGLAGGEAVTVSGGAALLLFTSGNTSMAILCLILAASAAGFLVFNWPPAKIFMGDVGSGFLGYTFAVLALASENMTDVPLIAWMVLLSVFIVDATATLVKRILQGKKFTEAHREHGYQRAVQSGFSHRKVTLWITAINLGIALIMSFSMKQAMVGSTFIVIYFLMMMLWIILNMQFTLKEVSSHK